MTFPYTTLPGLPIDTKRPLIPIRFIYKEKSTLPILSLVDSGADYSYLTVEIADLLGISLKGIKPQKSFGINGSPFLCFSSEITIDLAGDKITIPVHFSPELTPAFPVILGQEGFFSQAKIIFERYSWNLEIKFLEENRQ